jgi:NAD(P)-dependent dehydrogenase (short-subunit alcohol dehydrogenase family)
MSPALDPRRQIQSETLGEAPSRHRLRGRRIVVVGAGQRAIEGDTHAPAVGNGRAIAMLCAREGARVGCVDVVRASVEDTCDLIAEEGGEAVADVADVSDAAAVAPSLLRCAERLGGLDGLVLNVGISKGLPLDKQSADAWDFEFAVNLRSHMLAAQAAMPLMREGGSIVLISSLAALRANARNPAYEASKAAQVALARSIAVAGEPHGVRCNAVLPGLIDTPLGRLASQRRPGRAAALPWGRQGTGWEVAYAALFLLSHESTYVNGHALLMDGGLSIGVARPAAEPTKAAS